MPAQSELRSSRRQRREVSRQIARIRSRAGELGRQILQMGQPGIEAAIAYCQQVRQTHAAACREHDRLTGEIEYWQQQAELER